MKTKIKLQFFIILMLTSILSISCEEDFIEKTTETTENILPDGFEAKNYTSEELESIPNFKPLYIKAKNYLYAKYPVDQIMREGEELAILDTSLATAMEIGEYKSFSFRINDFSVENEFKNLVIEMYGEDDYLLSIVTYKHDFTEGAIKFEEKEILEGTFNPFVEVDGVTARCSYQLIIVGMLYIYNGEILKDVQLVYDYSILCQGGGNGPGANGGTIPNIGYYTGTGNSAYSPNPVYTNSAQLINSLRPIPKSRFNELYGSSKNRMLNYIDQNLNFPTRLSNIKEFINRLSYVENHDSYNFFNYTVPLGQHISNTTIRSEVFNYLEAVQYSLNQHPFVLNMTDQIFNNQTLFSTITPFIIEKQIDDSQLDDCTKSVLNAIRNSQNNDVATIIAKLDTSPTIYNTKINTANIGSIYTILGRTNWTGFINNGNSFTPYDYTIQVNLGLVNQGTKLQIYATILHELIHAYFLSIIDDCHQANNCALLQTYPELWNYYVQNQNSGNITNAISQHNQLALSYVTVIADALEEYQPGLPSQHYKDLAWGGLKGTTPYENNDPATRILTPEDRIRIEKINEAEALNQPQYNPSGVLTYFPQGTPCN